MVEMFPAEVRCSASAIGYNLCIGLFGGTTPLIATYLVQRTADDFSPVYYLMAMAALSFVILQTYHRRFRLEASYLVIVPARRNEQRGRMAGARIIQPPLALQEAVREYHKGDWYTREVHFPIR